VKSWLGVMVGALLLAGCSSKEDTTLLKQLASRQQKFHTIQKTQKVIFDSQDGESVTLLVRYLSSEESSSTEPERFLIASYPSSTFQFRLNGSTPLRISSCDRLRGSSAVSFGIPSWYRCHYVEFSPVSDPALKLEILTPQGQKETLLFSKGPKFLITKPKF